MKFPGILGLTSSSSSSLDDDIIPVVRPTPVIDMGSLRNRLIQANTGPPDELWGLSNYVGKLLDRYFATQDATAHLMLLAHLYYATASTMRKMEHDQLPFAPVPTLKTPNSQVQTGRGRRVAIVGGPIFGLQRVRRRAVLREIFAAVAGKLADSFDTTINVLPKHLEDRFGIEMDEEGVKTDRKVMTEPEALSGVMPNLMYLNEMGRSRYKVVIRQGRAFALRREGDVAQEVPLDTTLNARSSYGGLHRTLAWGFVLSMSRDLYVAHHAVARDGDSANRFFHSSYFSGGNVLAAGDCIFKDGWLRSVTNLSGHYKPADASLVHFLELFKMSGTDLSQVRVASVGSLMSEYELGSRSVMNILSNDEEFIKYSMTASAFLASHREWTRDPAKPQRRHDIKNLREVARAMGKI